MGRRAAWGGGLHGEPGVRLAGSSDADLEGVVRHLRHHIAAHVDHLGCTAAIRGPQMYGWYQ